MKNNLNLKLKVFVIFTLSFISLPALLMLSAGTIYYWPGWIFSLAIIIPAAFIVIYFLKNSPEFLQRRLMFKEKEMKQRTIIKFAGIIYFIAFILPGLDYRFGWSNVPFWLVLVANIGVMIGYLIVFAAFKVNAYAGRTVEIFEGQKVISTGPYGIVRHPMYLGILVMFLFMPVALGSFWSLFTFLGIVPILMYRAINEEKTLEKELEGYSEYCNKVKYRIVPFVW